MPADFQRIGLGTYSEENREQWRENVSQALDAGYRAIDTAEVYGNEEYIGEGIDQSEVPREDIFLATKTVHEVEPGPEHEDILSGVEGSLDRLGTDYIDLLYVHWPADLYDPETTLGAFDELREKGKIERVGVCNFEPHQLNRAQEVLDSPLFANQIEMHPLLQQEELVAYAQDHDQWIVAFCPLAQGAVFDVPEIQEIAQRHDASPAQVSLAWLLSKDNVAVIPKASSLGHLHDNLAAQELNLSDEDIVQIDEIEREKRIIDRDYAPWNR
ncbi:aldo/keto reductase [Halococcus salsus]|uniref:aldo/keto reductase n=1 Tax=Halococcus salsus TaxID=2162894 RepID=UPI001357954D|nr:aldo/keto reductase [Halococcus salsus]